MQFSVNYQAIMFLSLSGVSITFANLYIFFHAVFIGCVWTWETQGGRFKKPSISLAFLFYKCKLWAVLYVLMLRVCLKRECTSSLKCACVELFMDIYIIYVCSAGIHTFTHCSLARSSTYSRLAHRELWYGMVWFSWNCGPNILRKFCVLLQLWFHWNAKPLSQQYRYCIVHY